MGYVYLIKEKLTDDKYKIGKSKSLKMRMKKFEIVLPFEFDIIHIIESEHYDYLEALLHKHFQEKRISGEWFKLTSKDVEWIKKGDFGELFKTNNSPMKRYSSARDVRFSVSIDEWTDEKISDLQTLLRIPKSVVVHELVMECLKHEELIQNITKKILEEKPQRNKREIDRV